MARTFENPGATSATAQAPQPGSPTAPTAVPDDTKAPQRPPSGTLHQPSGSCFHLVSHDILLGTVDMDVETQMRNRTGLVPVLVISRRAAFASIKAQGVIGVATEAPKWQMFLWFGPTINTTVVRASSAREIGPKRQTIGSAEVVRR
ncbi:hypothetical protein CONLIGDRAFT_685749 [Coniochaeta ligniaria NRRL 30616]|uniref:Uncharacterized protein n=1 Tax=Coniochaeta ligniaria NRRL 30616 TaxID=1408157 RepID=A0A1J7J4Q0_9PEZI|nr:hypothetical protein CONLIGDRAFT_685749 [Coniochaeta ligniaria NRRL 30616]